MGTIIKEIKIPDENYSFISDEGEEGDVLKNLSKINIFVGENNSGKSRFLRSIVAENELEFSPINHDFYPIARGIPCLKGNMDYLLNRPSVLHELNELKKLIDEIEDFKFLKPNSRIVFDLAKIYDYLDNLRQTYPSSSIKDINYSNNDIFRLISAFNGCFEDLKRPIKEVNLDYEFKKIYIPTLRGLRPVNYGDEDDENIASYYLTKDVYKIRTKNDYFNKKENFEVFTGLTIYENIKKELLGSFKHRKAIQDLENYLSEKFFEYKDITLLPTSDGNGTLTIKIGKEQERLIYDLGDGIQSIITMVYSLFYYKDLVKENENILVFIEEPEHLLHPSLQRRLIETFMDERFKNYQFFFTTHSNHFLDIALDFEGISMFTVNKSLDENEEDTIPQFSIKNVSFGDDDVLNVLGVRNSSVFLPNCNILVEGFTDKLYFGHYLNIYQDHMNFKRSMEDRHYTFEETGGSDITNSPLLNQDNSIKLSRFFAIRDRDDQLNSNNPLNDKLEKKFGNNFYLLNCREVENLLKEDIILKIVKNDSRCADMDINEDFEYKDYKDERLGGFIDKVILNGQERVYEKKNSNGKLNNKKGFFFKAKKYIETWDDLSPEAQEITEKIYNFINENNS